MCQWATPAFSGAAGLTKKSIRAKIRLEMRIPGLGGDVMAKLGASPVSLPGGQIYENLVSGAIDATEWVGPWNDEAMKFYEAANIIISRVCMSQLHSFTLVSTPHFGAAGKSDPALGEAVAQGEDNNFMAEYNAETGYLERLKDQGVVVKEFNDDVYSAFKRGSDEVYARRCAHSALAKKIHESMVNARKTVGDYVQLNDVAYTNKARCAELNLIEGCNSLIFFHIIPEILVMALLSQSSIFTALRMFGLSRIFGTCVCY